MEFRERVGLAGLWLVVALLMAAATLRPPLDLASPLTLAGLVAVGAGLFLAVVYLFDPYGLVTDRPF